MFLTHTVTVIDCRDKMAVNEEHEQKMRELQRSYVDFLDDSDRYKLLLIERRI